MNRFLTFVRNLFGSPTNVGLPSSRIVYVRNFGGRLPEDWDIAEGSAVGHVMFLPDCVALALTQNDGMVHQGAELVSDVAFLYGTYEFLARVGTTATEPHGKGQTVPGGISSLSSYANDNLSEITLEVQGKHPNDLHTTNFRGATAQQTSVRRIPNLGDDFHWFKYVWKPDSIEFYVDDRLVGVHDRNVPDFGAAVHIGHWGTDARSWGGEATPGVTRFMYVKQFKYTEL